MVMQLECDIVPSGMTCSKSVKITGVQDIVYSWKFLPFISKIFKMHVVVYRPILTTYKNTSCNVIRFIPCKLFMSAILQLPLYRGHRAASYQGM